MDGIANIAGLRTVPLKVGDKIYQLNPMVLSEYAERESYILSLRPDPWERMRSIPSDLPPDVREQIVKTVMEDINSDAHSPRVISMREENIFDQSLHGLGWRLMRALRKNHPEVDTVGKALAIIELAGTERLKEIDNKLSLSENEDILKKSTSPAADQVAPGTEKCLGPSSTESSLSGTAGGQASSTV